MEIGDKVWFKGDEVVIATAPYMMYGGEFQDALTQDGSTVSIVTEAQRSKDVSKARESWNEQQAGFARLNKGD